MTEALDEEIEKGTYLRHTVATLRIDRPSRSAWAAIKISKSRNSTPSIREPQGGLTEVDQNSTPNVNESYLAVVVEWPANRQNTSG
jgi:hypothetical protein